MGAALGSWRSPESGPRQPVESADSQTPRVNQVEAGKHPPGDVSGTVAERGDGLHDLLKRLEKFGGKLFADQGDGGGRRRVGRVAGFVGTALQLFEIDTRAEDGFTAVSQVCR